MLGKKEILKLLLLFWKVLLRHYRPFTCKQKFSNPWLQGVILIMFSWLYFESSLIYFCQSMITCKNLGHQVPWRTVFLVEYFGPMLIFPLFIFSSKMRGLLYNDPRWGINLLHSFWIYILMRLHSFWVWFFKHSQTCRQ